MMKQELEELAASALHRADVVVEVHSTGPFLSRGLAHIGETPPRIEVWAGWPPMDIRLMTLHEAAHLGPATLSIPNHSSGFWLRLNAYAKQAGIPGWWLLTHHLGISLGNRLPWGPKQWRCGC